MRSPGLGTLWPVRRYPWMLVSGGAGGGVYRSVDGGGTWKKLTEGLPEGPTGRIGLAASPSNPRHIYALVEAKKGILWDSVDLGDHWREVSDNHLEGYITGNTCKINTMETRRVIRCEYDRTVDILPGVKHTFHFKDEADQPVL